MTLRFLPFPALAAVSLFLAACASGPTVDPSITAAVAAKGVDQGTYLKICHGSVLDYTDIQNLVIKKVPSSIITGYLASTRKVYDFSYGQLQQLKDDGATPQVLNFLTETQGFYGNNTPAQKARTKKEQKDQYYNSPYYQNKAPFAKNPPIIDDWYDSGYEESLYSPFSFN